ncbi:MAG: hypothetical protein ACR2P8_02890, partial [Myxococcota bacterium]
MMQWGHTFRLALVTCLLAMLSLGAAAERGDLWIHPRGESYDPNQHYRDSQCELYYKAENDIHAGLGRIVIRGGSEPSVTAELGPDILEVVERNSGWLRPVLHWDSDGDGRVDRTLVGQLEGRTARFTGDALREVPPRDGVWQLGIVYKAGDAGAPQLNGRYVASVGSDRARFDTPGPEDLAQVGSGPPAGLVILKHRGERALDFAAFAADPEPFLDDFDELSRQKDADDWTTKGQKGKLRTHFDEEDFIIVRVAGNVRLAIEWGDLPLVDFLERYLGVAPGPDGCYSSLDATVVGTDGVQRPVPNRILYCPAANVAAFDAPDGYQIFLSALHGSEVVETTEASTSVMDNIRLYAAEVWPRSPKTRATATIQGNVIAGFHAAGDDVVDMGRHLVTGTERIDPHTGQVQYRTSPLLALPWAARRLYEGKPVQAFGEILVGAFSAVAIAAKGVSAVSNAVVNPLLQGTVGLASVQAADSTGHWVGAFSQAAVQNLPFSERSVDAFNPVAAWQHNRAFARSGYTRTDTQLNIDRVMTLANLFAIRAIVISSGNGGSAGGTGGTARGGPPGGGGTPPPPTVTPPP